MLTVLRVAFKLFDAAEHSWMRIHGGDRINRSGGYSLREPNPVRRKHTGALVAGWRSTGRVHDSRRLLRRQAADVSLNELRCGSDVGVALAAVLFATASQARRSEIAAMCTRKVETERSLTG